MTPELKAQLLAELSNAFVVLIPLAFSVLVALVAAGLHALSARLRTEAKQTAFTVTGAKLAAFAELVVVDIEKTLKPKLEAAAGDRHLTAEELKQLRDAAIQRFLELIGLKNQAAAEKTLGLAQGGLAQLAGGLVERAVDKVSGREPPAVLDPA
jgi:hypothetical protein